MKNIKEIKKGDIVTYTTGKVNYGNKPEKYIEYFDDNFCNYNGGKREDKYAKYVIKNELLDKELDKLFKEKLLLENFIEKELLRLGKYDEVVQLIVYYKEQCLEKFTWQQISLKVHYSVIQCKRIYKKWKCQRAINDDTI